MKKQPLNIILSASFIVLMIISFFINDPFALFVKNYATSDTLLKPSLKTDIHALSVKLSGTETLFLKKANDVWKISEKKDAKIFYDVEDSKITEAIDKFFEMKKFHKITSKKDKYKELEVTNESGMLITLFDNNQKELVSFILGKSGATRGSESIRLTKEDTVYSVKGGIKTTWNNSINYFRNKKLLKLIKENIKAVEIKGKQNYLIQKDEKDNKYYLIQKGKKQNTNQAKIEDLLRNLTELEGTTFLETSDNTGKNYSHITIQTTTGLSLELNINESKKDNKFFIKSTHNPYWIEIANWSMNNILKDSKELIEEVKNTPKNPKK